MSIISTIHGGVQIKDSRARLILCVKLNHAKNSKINWRVNMSNANIIMQKPSDGIEIKKANTLMGYLKLAEVGNTKDLYGFRRIKEALTVFYNDSKKFIENINNNNIIEQFEIFKADYEKCTKELHWGFGDVFCEECKCYLSEKNICAFSIDIEDPTKAIQCDLFNDAIMIE
jgi:hypothetical protein